MNSEPSYLHVLDEIDKENEEGQGWPQPEPLFGSIPSVPYPLDALPQDISKAVNEVYQFVQAPLPMVATSALAALSLAGQAYVDAQRAVKLTGPASLYFLGIADSGERKSTCDGFFTQPIREYEAQQAEMAKPILKDYQSDVDAWEAKRSGTKDKIRQLAKEKKPTEAMIDTLREIGQNKPEPPRIPRLFYADATPEALAYGLAKQWPSGGVFSSEAGIVFGSHGMGKDSVMRNLGLLNQLWDGTSLKIDRRTSESFTVQGARLTIALQIQEPTLREFFSKTGALARGSGFLARFLVYWPQSTQGRRLFREAPAHWPYLALFNKRIESILNQPAPTNEQNALEPLMLTLSPGAKKAWIAFHDDIEGELTDSGDLYDVRDVASKSADNAARLAALFHLFKQDGGAISKESFESASLIVLWHLSESRRFFGELAAPQEMLDAVKVDTWILKHCRDEKALKVGKNHVRRFGPVRNGPCLDSALNELTELNRLQKIKEGRKFVIKVNPALMEVTK